MQTLILKTRKCTQDSYINKFKTATLALILLMSVTVARAQIYYSNFATPIASDYSTAVPNGGTCVVPALNNPSNFADASLTNYTQISGLLNLPIACTNINYSLRAKLNFPVGVTSAPIGYHAGFRLSMSHVISLALLGSNLEIRTYLGGSLQQTVPGTSLIGLSLLAIPNTATDVYLVASAPFDELELVFNSSFINAGVGIDYRIYYAVGAPQGTLPVTFEGLLAKIQGGNLQVDWNTVSEKDNDKFIVQGSADGKTWTDLGVVATKATDGNSSVKIAYSFSRQWSGTMLAGFGLLGLLLLPAIRNRLMRLGMLVVVMSIAIACAKENDGFRNLEEGNRTGKATYIRVAQVDKDGSTNYTDAVIAKR